MGKVGKFKDNLDTYVFTTKFVTEKNSPIVLVSHDEEGDWQFLSGEGPVESEVQVILLGEMIQHDPTILEVADLPLGAKAFRNDQNSAWRIRKNFSSDN